MSARSVLNTTKLPSNPAVTKGQLRAELRNWKLRIESLNQQFGANGEETKYAKWASEWIRKLAKRLYPEGPDKPLNGQ